MSGLHFSLFCLRKEGKLPRQVEFQFFVRLLRLLDYQLPWQSPASADSVLVGGEEEGEGEEDRDQSQEDSLGQEWVVTIDRLDALSQALCRGSGECGAVEEGVLESVLGCVEELLEHNVYQVTSSYFGCVCLWLLAIHSCYVPACVCVCH